ncbi:MAG: DEAD/DEAH box helicase family protein [Succinivibrio sp.]|nr:DEAD/DEAH box helicase family protein [Succinivibrio sp.]
MDLIDNINKILKDDIISEIKNGSEISIVASCFSIYAFKELKESLKNIKSFRFIYSSPTFTESEIPKEYREFYIPKQSRESSICGSSFEIKLKNELTQKAISEECAKWALEKADFKSNNDQSMMQGFIIIKNGDNSVSYTPISGFTTTDLGCIKGNDSYTFINKMESDYEKSPFSNVFEKLWNNSNIIVEVKDKVLDSITSAYTDKSPEFIYFFALYNLFKDYLDENANGDNFANESTGFKKSVVWSKLYSFQKDASLAIIHKLEKYNGCILADSVGLGKTFTALSVIKYYECRNRTVLVLCPKKLSDNWNSYRGNYKTNPLIMDKLRYDVLYHTDVGRKSGFSNGLDLGKLNWENYDLVVIDESHNFRNGGTAYIDDDTGEEKLNRYQTLLENVLKKGVKTKVLMLSATPVNNRFNDLKNQLALAYYDDKESFEEKLKIDLSIDDLFRQAQLQYNTWSKLPAGERTSKNLLQRLSIDLFRVLDGVTIARSRKHIRKYYASEDLGKFPERVPPISYSPKLTTDDSLTYEDIYSYLCKLNLEVYVPSAFVLPSKRDLYENKSKKGLSHQGRELGIRKLMQVNLLKRLESSILSFKLTLDKVYTQISDTLQLVESFLNTRKLSIPESDITSLFDDKFEDYNYEFDEDEDADGLYEIDKGKNFSYKLQDLDCISWQRQLSSDKSVLDELKQRLNFLDSTNDLKLQKLKEFIGDKVVNNLNAGNKKVLIFTAFADTAGYLYDELADYIKKTYSLNTALVTGSVEGRTTVKGLKSDFNTVLTCFSPKSKEREKAYPNIKDDIDILIGTDCISEGQNLQDCDCVVNYDIHWNPVRIIQRFGRVDRLGSSNEKIQLVNFWPNMKLDEYIKLKNRVCSRMAMTAITSTGDDPINPEDVELDYRKAQLEKLKSEVVDLEEMDDGISITDLGLNDFRLDLMEFIKTNSNLDRTPFGLSAITQSTDDCQPGVIFVLKNTSSEIKQKKNNQIYPYYLVYVAEDGAIVCDYENPKMILDKFRLLCKYKSEPVKSLCDCFESETNNGKNMKKYSDLLSKCIENILDVKESSDIDSLFSLGPTSVLSSNIKGLDDFELICFLVIKKA